MGRFAARARVLTLAWVIIGSTGCADATSPDPATAAAVGTWQYQADQLSPSLTLDGSVYWQAVPGSALAFEGSYSIVERSGALVRAVAGPSAGQVSRDSVVEFSLRVLDEERLHIGILRADSLLGEWVHMGTPAARGTFRMRRVPSS